MKTHDQLWNVKAWAHELPTDRLGQILEECATWDKTHPSRKAVIEEGQRRVAILIAGLNIAQRPQLYDREAK